MSPVTQCVRRQSIFKVRRFRIPSGGVFLLPIDYTSI